MTDSPARYLSKVRRNKAKKKKKKKKDREKRGRLSDLSSEKVEEAGGDRSRPARRPRKCDE